MEEYSRSLLPILESRIDERRRFIQVIAGPRQVGKTTLAQQLLNRTRILYHFASADAIGYQSESWIAQQWETARFRYRQGKTNEFLLVLDEIQKIPNWSEYAKREWDSDSVAGRQIKLILLGSSRLLLQQGLTESLTGRYEIHYMGHWTYNEMKAAFGWQIDQFVWHGGYPGAAFLIEDELRWKQYVLNALIEPSISRDILMLTRVDKPALLRRLFELGCYFSGQILSFTKILGQMQDAGNTTTLSHYLNLLSQAGLLTGIEKFSPRMVRKRASIPKFMVFNTALITAQLDRNYHSVRQNPDQWGRLVESAIGAHLLNHSLQSGFKVYYWREQNREIDFVLEYDGMIIGLEVKSGKIKTNAGMFTFQKQFDPEKILLVGDDGLPWQEFLQINPVDLFE